MAGTQFFLHAATSGNTSQTLPSATKSTLTAYGNLQAQSINSSLNTTKGSSQTSISTTFGINSTNENYFIGKWVSDLCINQSSIASGSWSYGFASSCSSPGNDYFPVDTATATKTYVCVYVYRPSTSTVVGKILDGYTGTGYQTGFTGEIQDVGTFTGVTVSGIIANDVLVFEAWASQTSGTSSTDVMYYYFDGTSVPSTSGNSASTCAAFITSPSAIAMTAYVTPLHTVSIYENLNTWSAVTGSTS